MVNIETGLLLMIVGMTSVFTILLIVINLGRGLIAVVNKYAPEEIIVKKQATPKGQVPAPAAAITDQTTAAIVSAVSVVSGGKGKIVKIEKL